MPRIPVPLDTDPGLDDAFAIMLAAQVANIVGITTVSGNAAIQHTTRNALALAQLLELDVPVHQGAAQPLVAPAQHATHIHGEEGFGGVTLPPTGVTVAGTDAADYLLQAASQHEGLWIVAIGPLTNLAVAVQRDPQFASRVAGISIMGGSTSHGNVTAAAEFNIWADPEAADVVFRSGAQLRMCGLNLTRQVLTSPDWLSRLAGMNNPRAALAAELLAYLHTRMLHNTGQPRAPMHDPCAVLAVTHPHLLQLQPRHCVVECKGEHTRGMTLVDARDTRELAPANMDVAYQIDAPAAQQLILDALH